MTLLEPLSTNTSRFNSTFRQSFAGVATYSEIGITISTAVNGMNENVMVPGTMCPKKYLICYSMGIETRIGTIAAAQLPIGVGSRLHMEATDVFAADVVLISPSKLGVTNMLFSTTFSRLE